MLSRRVFVSVVLAAFGSIVTAQSALDRSQDSPHTQVVRMDVVVANPLGRPIQDLRATDFDLRVDGMPRQVRSTALRVSDRLSGHPARPIRTAEDEELAARERGTRVFAFFLDDFHISPGLSAARAAELVSTFIVEKVHAEDLVAVIRPLDDIRSIRFTRDRALVYGAIASFSGRKGEYRPRTPFERQTIGVDTATISSARTRNVVAGLRDLGMRIGRMQADRPAVVFISEGFPDMPSSGDGASDWQDFLRASSAHHFPVYTFNPAAPEESLSPTGERERARNMLAQLAADSGGLFISPGDSIHGFARLAHDTESDYSLTYESSTRDAKPQQIELRVNRRDARVRTRTVYWPASSSDGNDRSAFAPSVAAGSRRELRRSPLIDVWVGVRPEPNGAGRLTVTWESRKSGDRAAHTVVIKARDTAGTALFDGSLVAAGTSESSADRAQFTTSGGRVELDLTIVDRTGTEIDREVRDFDVPDPTSSLSPAPRILPAEIVRVRSGREFESRMTTATPVASRSFARTDRLLVRVPVFDSSGVRVAVTARLLNRSGRLMRDLEPVGHSAEAEPLQFLLGLASLPADLYQIEMVATNANGSTTERVSFRLAQ